MLQCPLSEVGGLARDGRIRSGRRAGAADQRYGRAGITRLLSQIADAHRAVDPFLHQIDGAIGEPSTSCR